MTIQQQITDRLHKAMKESNAFEKAILRVILSEFNYKGKDLSDEVASEVLSKIRKDLYETNTVDSLKEAVLVSEYLPKIMTEDEITSSLKELNITNPNLKLKQMKDLFDKQYPSQDGAIVVKLIKQVLQ